MFVTKAIATDSDTAKKIIFKLLGCKKDKTMTIDDFNKVFCKCIFKESLVQMFDAIDKVTVENKEEFNSVSEVPLTLKLGAY